MLAMSDTTEARSTFGSTYDLRAVGCLTQRDFLLGVESEGLAFTRRVSVCAADDLLSLAPDGAELQRHEASPRGETCLFAWKGRLAYLVRDGNMVDATVAAHSPTAAEDLVRQLEERCASGWGRSRGIAVHTWHGYACRPRVLQGPTWDSVALNYPPAVRAELERVMGLRTLPGANLIIWHGDPGTGKTSAARALLREWSEWCQLHYIHEPRQFLEYRLSSFLEWQGGATSSAPRVCLIEDADDVLTETGQFGREALRELLNVTDGLFGDLGVVFLVTTNLKLSHIHPAVTRAGRCLALTRFRSFTPKESLDWARRHDALAGALTHEHATLGALFALEHGRSAYPAGEPEPEPGGQYL